MNVRNTLPVFLAALLGFLLGAMFTHQTTVKAQSGAIQVYTTSDSLPGAGSTSVYGAQQIVGFSCVEEVVGSIGSPKCYIAYVK
jgi:ABC-type phosphate transport system substrate-binding protein